MWRLADLDGARIALIGCGREGRATERVLRDRLPASRLHVFAERSPEFDPASPSTIAPLEIDPRDFDVVLRSPGVPPHHPGLNACRDAGIPMTSSSSIWFAERPECSTVAVTGSKGKSTTSSLLTHMLEGCGRTVELAGNIGRPLIELLDLKADAIVIELSSYQLIDLVGAPSVGAITRLFPEHADWHGSTEAYYQAKLRLVDLLDGGPLWFNGKDPVLSDALADATDAHAANRPPGLHVRETGLWTGAGPAARCLFDREHWLLPGRHNLDNLVLAVAVAESLGLERERLLEAARDFRGLSNRLESLGRVGGVEYINDSISTTPHATRAALESDLRPAVLIAGGQDRRADWSPVAEAGIALRGLVALPDTGADVAARLVEAGLVPVGSVREVQGLDQAVSAACDLARPGDRVLFSPGAPSFHRFRDFEARGEAFRNAVRALCRQHSAD